MTVGRELYIVIPAHDRQGMLAELLGTLDVSPAHVFLIDNNSDRPLHHDFGQSAIVVQYGDRNIQAMWNFGWELASKAADGKPYAVAFLNSDAMTSAETLVRMTDALDTLNASLVSSDYSRLLYDGGILRKRIPGPVSWECAMSGWGFVVRGELQSRFDEQFVWWYGDPDFEWRARQEFGGSVVLGGAYIENRDANGAQRDFPELNFQCDRDRVAFINKWGVSSQDWTIYNEVVYNAKLRLNRSMM